MKTQKRRRWASFLDDVNRPPLKGTKRQIEWATDIRNQLFETLCYQGYLVFPEYTEQAMAKTPDDAAWWIENKDSCQPLCMEILGFPYSNWDDDR